jgi:hypothetical protein
MSDLSSAILTEEQDIEAFLQHLPATDGDDVYDFTLLYDAAVVGSLDPKVHLDICV